LAGSIGSFSAAAPTLRLMSRRPARVVPFRRPFMTTINERRHRGRIAQLPQSAGNRAKIEQTGGRITRQITSAMRGSDLRFV
jgi:hypothetical protein